VKPKQPPGEPMTLGNVRAAGDAYCLNDGLKFAFHSRTDDELKHSMTSMHRR
jgi:hypothetical protein